MIFSLNLWGHKILNGDKSLLAEKFIITVFEFIFYASFVGFLKLIAFVNLKKYKNNNLTRCVWQRIYNLIHM